MVGSRKQCVPADLAAMKRNAQQLDDDPLDRALSYREPGLERRPLAELGFSPANRGQLGISSVHVHEVAHSCLAGVRLHRYKQVDAVRVPEHGLVQFRQANEERCRADALMPKYSPVMKLACATKTHFVHANKLRLEGDRTLMNDNRTPIVSKSTEEGSEDRKILEEGVLVSIYAAKLWDDLEALEALMGADNDNADVEMAEDEIQALGRVEIAIKVCTADGKDLTAANVIAAMQRAGLRSYSLEQTRSFAEFRLVITEKVSKAFRQLVFAAVSGRVVVQASDYAAVSILDVRAMWVKVGLLMQLYVSTYNAKWPQGSSVIQLQRTTATAPKFPAGVLKELAVEGSTLVKLDKMIAKLLRHYVIPNPYIDKVMFARRDLFVAVGKLAWKIGAALEKATSMALAQLKAPLKPEERTQTTELVLKNQFADIEHKYRVALVDACVLTEEKLPAALNPKGTKGVKEEKKNTLSVANISELGQSADGSVLITKEWLMGRLKLDSLPGPVVLTWLGFLGASSAPAETSPQAAGGSERTKRALWEATVESIAKVNSDDAAFPSGWSAQIRYGVAEYKVDSDILQPKTVEEAPKTVEEEPVVSTLPLFEWDSMVPTSTRRVAAWALDEAFIMSFEAVKGVQIEKVGEKEFPCVLQARASRAFNVGECVLFPFCVEEFDGWLTNATDAGATKKYEDADLLLMSKDAITRCCVKVFSKEKKSRGRTADGAKAAKKAVSETYWVNSPLFFLEEKRREGAPRLGAALGRRADAGAQGSQHAF